MLIYFTTPLQKDSDIFVRMFQERENEYENVNVNRNVNEILNVNENVNLNERVNKKRTV